MKASIDRVRRRPWWRGFGVRLAAVMAALVAAALVVVGWRVIDVNRAAIADATRERLFTGIGDVAHTIEASFDGVETELAAVGRTLADAALPEEQRITMAASQIEASTELSVVGVYDERGVLIDTLRERGDAPAPPAQLPAELIAAAGTRAHARGDVHFAPGGPSFLIVVAVRGAAATWYLGAPVRLTTLQDRVERLARDEFGDDVEALAVIDRDHRIIAHADRERIGTVLPRALADTVGAAVFDSTNRLAVFREAAGSRGRVVVAARNLSGVPWVVLATRPHATVYASIPQLRRTVILVLFGTLVIAVAVAVVLTRRMLAPIRRLVAYTGELAERRWDRRVVVTSGDELEDLAGAMNRAAADLGASEQILERERRVRGELGRYLPAQVVDQVVGDQGHSLVGQRREVTVLFADVASFTTLAERRPPEQVVQLLNQLFTMLTEIVFRHGGTVDKFLGDCVMAFWNAPTSQADHARRAVAAARDMLRWIELGNELWERELGVKIHLAIGVNTGEAIVGNLGSERRMEYTCIGDTVNIAARLEALARPTQILVTRATADAAVCGVATLGLHQLVGREQPVELFEVVI